MPRRAPQRPSLITAAVAALSLVLVTVAVPASAATTSACSTTTLAQAQSRILGEVNAARTTAKLGKVSANAAMNTVATNWSKKMASANAMSHNPSYSTQIPAGWRSAGENVAVGYAVSQVSAAWMKSPGHRANILRSSFTHIGIGLACSSSGRPYYTQVFAGYPAGVAGVTARLTAPTPTISGTPKANLTLTARPGTWTKGTALRYQWYVGGAAVSGATKATFMPVHAQRGKTVTVKVTGSKAGYTTVSKTSKATAKIAGLSTLARSTPTIVGNAKVGAVLTAKPGAWTSGTTFWYQWKAAGKDIAGATKAVYVPRAADRGKALTVTVTGRKAGFFTVIVTSRATASIATGTLVAGAPTISGEPHVGATLTAVPGTWTRGTALAYQWSADGQPIPGATAPTFVPDEEHAGAALRVSVTGTLTGFHARTVNSPITGAVKPLS